MNNGTIHHVVHGLPPGGWNVIDEQKYSPSLLMELHLFLIKCYALKILEALWWVLSGNKLACSFSVFVFLKDRNYLLFIFIFLEPCTVPDKWLNNDDSTDWLKEWTTQSLNLAKLSWLLTSPLSSFKHLCVKFKVSVLTLWCKCLCVQHWRVWYVKIVFCFI